MVTNGKSELSALSALGRELDDDQLAQVNGGYYWACYHWEDFIPGAPGY
ncbi:bacteriocin [Streptosporangium sp. NPDC005286]